MNIIKPGKTPDSISFTCSACGCEYVADEKDYTLKDFIIVKNYGWTGRNTYNVVCRVYSCTCPCCGRSNDQTVSMYGG